MLELFPQGLPADPQDPGRLSPIAFRELKHGDDVLPLRLFPHLPERSVLDHRRERVQNVSRSSHLGSPRRILAFHVAQCLTAAARHRARM